MTRERGLATIVFLALCMGAVTLHAQAWIGDYDDALTAIKRQEWSKAEQLLKAAIQRNPRQGRRVFFRGTRFDIYIPEYYLAVVYANQQRASEALDLFQKVERDGLVTASTPEYSELRRLVATSRDAVEKTRLAKGDGGRPTGPGGTGGVPVIPTTGDAGAKGEDATAVAARRETERRERFASLLSQGASDLTNGRFDAARSRASEARALGIDEGRVAEFEKTIDVAVVETNTQTALNKQDWPEAQRLTAELRKLDPRNGRAASFDAAISKGLASAATAVIRNALRSFFGGDYQTTIRLLEPVAASAQPSSRALFYLACSHAALALLESPRGDERLQKGRQLYTRARKGPETFAVDRRFISPQVLRELEAPGR